jgi:rhomboid protease GluP
MTAPGAFGRRGGLATPGLGAKAPAVARLRAASGVTEVADEARGSRIPLVTLALIGVFTLLYLGERRFGFEHATAPFSYRTIIALGGVDRDLVVGQGQWWRLLTAPTLHGSIEHLVGNAAVMALVGAGLERLIGRAWFAAIFAYGAIAGSICSVAMNAPWTVSVGASGGIMALLTATYVCSFHPEADEDGARMRWWVYRLAIPSLIPFGAAGGGNVDYSGHIGGALGGMAMGYLLQFIWSEDRALPPFRRQAAIAAGAAGVAAGIGFIIVAANYPAYAARQAPLIPDAEIPKSTADSLGRSAALIVLYPRDPRGHLLRAVAAAETDDVLVVEREARAGLAEPDILARDFPPVIELELKALLALSLAAQHRNEEAFPLAQSVCNRVQAMPEAVKIRTELRQQGLCA